MANRKPLFIKAPVVANAIQPPHPTLIPIFFLTARDAKILRNVRKENRTPIFLLPFFCVKFFFHIFLPQFINLNIISDDIIKKIKKHFFVFLPFRILDKFKNL